MRKMLRRLIAHDLFPALVGVVLAVAVFITVIILLPPNSGDSRGTPILDDVCIENGVPQIISVDSSFNRQYIVYKRNDGAYIMQNAWRAREYQVLYYGECNGERTDRTP